MDHVREAIGRFSTHQGTVLVRGEPGTGKSLVAEMLGAAGAEVIDCCDAQREREGATPSPRADVVVVEEVGDASRELQCLLIDFVRARGSAVRVIATTSRDLERFARNGKLLPEFLRSLVGPAIWIPPLRTRRSDIP